MPSIYLPERLDLLDGSAVHAALVERLGGFVVVAPIEHADRGGDGEAGDEAGVPLHHHARQLSPDVADVDAAGRGPEGKDFFLGSFG